MKKSNLMPTVVLSSICVIAVALLAFVNLFTAPVINANQEEKIRQGLLEVMPNGGRFDKIDISELPEGIADAYKASNGGYVFQMSVTGFKSGLVVLCGISSDGKITGSKCVQSSETNGKEHILGEKYIGKTFDNFREVEIISNSTKTCEGYGNAIKLAFESFNILEGGGSNE